MSAVENEKIWLVKSSSNILGPFALEEVIQLLTSKHLSLIDEIRSPDSRWMFIREHKQFANIVNFIREQHSEVKEDTGSTQLTIAKIYMAKEQPPMTGEAKPVEVQKTSQLKTNRPQIYVATDELKYTKTVQQERSLPWAVVVLAVLIIAGGGWFYLTHEQKPVQQYSSNDYARFIDDAMEIGDFEKAYANIQNLEKLEKISLKRKIQIAEILIVGQNQNVQARQMLDELLKEANIPERKIEIENLRGVSFLNEGQYTEARKVFAEILKLEPTYEPTLVNNMESYVLEGLFAEALDQFKQIMLSGVRDSSVFLLRSLSIYKTAEAAAKLQSTMDDLLRFVDRFTFYHPEATMMLIAFQTKLNLQKDLPATISKLLKIDPDLTKKHVFNPAIHNEAVSWKVLGPLCLSVANEVRDVLSQKSLLAYCKYQMGDISGALELVEKTRIQFQRDGNLISLQTFLLFKLKRLADAKGLIQANQGVGNELMVSTSAWICQEQNDWSCAEKEWRRIMSMNSQNVAAYAGLALKEKASGSMETFNDYLRQGLTYSDKYRPLLELKER